MQHKSGYMSKGYAQFKIGELGEPRWARFLISSFFFDLTWHLKCLTNRLGSLAGSTCCSWGLVANLTHLGQKQAMQTLGVRNVQRKNATEPHKKTNCPFFPLPPRVIPLTLTTLCIVWREGRREGLKTNPESSSNKHRVETRAFFAKVRVENYSNQVHSLTTAAWCHLLFAH